MPATSQNTVYAGRIDAGRVRASRAHFRVRPPTRSGWTILSLKDLRALHHCFRGDLTETAAAMGETRVRCDRALNALLGRTEAEALAVLERRA